MTHPVAALIKAFVAFLKLVQTMRAAQAKYFKSHTQTDLQRAKFLEHQVDTQVAALLKEYDHTEPQVEQLSLPAESELKT